MSPTTESELKELRDLSMSQREEMRLGFADSRNEIQRIEAKADTKFAEVNGNIKALDQRLSGDIKALDQRLSGDIKALDQKLSGDIKALDQKVTGIDDRLKNQEVTLNQIGIKLGDLNLLLVEMKGDLKIVKQPIEFWEFVKRAVVSGLTVTVVGGLLLTAWKLVIFGTMKV
jgi:hypothetical protein